VGAHGLLPCDKGFSKAAFAISAENPQLLYTATLAGNTPYAVVGSAGLSASLLNQTISACSPSTSIVNYTNQVQTDSAGSALAVAIPVYKTLNSCANLANISFNKAPDMLAKIALDPGFGHYEIFGIARFFHEMVYPGETTNSNLYGNYTDVQPGPSLAGAGCLLSGSDHRGSIPQQHRPWRRGRQHAPSRHQGQVHIRRQNPVRTRRRTLRRFDAVRRNVERRRRTGAYPQPLRPA
jgi:hypothetical protein